MNRKLRRIHEKRELLIARAAAQRSTLGLEIEPWRVPLAVADQGLAALRFIRSHPTWMVGGAVALGLLRPRNLGKWLGRALLSWQLLQGLRSSARVPDVTR